MNHRKLKGTKAYYRVREDRRRQAVDWVAALQFDRPEARPRIPRPDGEHRGCVRPDGARTAVSQAGPAWRYLHLTSGSGGTERMRELLPQRKLPVNRRCGKDYTQVSLCPADATATGGMLL